MQNHLTTAEKDYLRILGEDIKRLSQNLRQFNIGGNHESIVNTNEI